MKYQINIVIVAVSFYRWVNISTFKFVINLDSCRIKLKSSNGDTILDRYLYYIINETWKYIVQYKDTQNMINKYI